MTKVDIRDAMPVEAPALGRLIGESFASLPVCQWLIEDEETRINALAGQFEILVEHAIKHGDVHVVGDDTDPTGVAVWFPPHKIPDMDDYDDRLVAAAGGYTPRFRELDAVMHAAHPDRPAHAYLAFLAVRGTDRDRGIGSALLEHHHRKLDVDGVPAYLEASGLRSRALYLRHGYVDHAPAYGPAGIHEFRPMWRSPT